MERGWGERRRGEEWFGRGRGKERTTPAEPPKKIPHPVLRCPRCGSKNVTRTFTEMPLRGYKCDEVECRFTFQTVEEGD